ncbi:MAG: RND transporter [Blastocatellia bacterium AA13]|nr:MAG: RND transporter [Blastocatellia bacterium AA13]
MKHSVKRRLNITRLALSRDSTPVRGIAAAAIVCLTTLALILNGCSVGPKYRKPTVQVDPAYKELKPDQFKEVDGWKTASPKDDVLRGAWWEMFNDSELNTIEDRVNTSNQNIALAEATYRLARAVVREGRSQYFPTVTTNPSASVSQFPTNSGRGANSVAAGTGQPGNSQPSSTGSTASTGRSNTITNFSLPFNVAWEPDLWGRVRHTVASSAYQAQAAAADIENVRLLMHAELAVDYFQLRGLDSQTQLLESTVEAYRKALELTNVLFHTGIVSEQDVVQAETQLETARAQLIDLGIQRAQFEHAIAVLAGTPASSFSVARGPLQSNPPAIPFGVPSELLERRPDIAGTERRVAAANEQIGVARAAYFPSLSITGGAGFQSNMIGTLLTWPSRFWSLGAALSQTLFDGGLRKAISEQARAAYDETVATYRQTVLTAFQNVEDNLATLRILSQERDQQEIAVRASERNLALATERYRAGIDSYLNVINAQTTLYTNQRTALTIRTEQMVASVQLIMAVGGGWNVSQLPKP